MLAAAAAAQPACLQSPAAARTRSYKRLWDADKDAYVRRYEKANKPLSSYEMDIREYANREVRRSVWRPRRGAAARETRAWS